MLEHKEYLYAIYQEKSFSRAAQKLYVSQPWLSAVVKKKEREIGFPLFHRNTNPITLTDAGKYYMEQIERVFEIEKNMKLHFEYMRAASHSELRIGSSMFFCTYVLPKVLEDFRASYPNLSVKFLEGNSNLLSEKLLEGQLDLVLEVERPEHKQIQSIPWATEEIVLAVPASYEINRKMARYRYSFQELIASDGGCEKKPPVPLSAFEKEPFLFLGPENDSYRRCMDMCRQAGFSPRITLLLSQMMTAYYLVCEGKGVAFLRSIIPKFVSPTDSIVFYRIDDPGTIRPIYLSYHAQRKNDMQPELLSLIHHMKRSGGSLPPFDI